MSTQVGTSICGSRGTRDAGTDGQRRARSSRVRSRPGAEPGDRKPRPIPGKTHKKGRMVSGGIEPTRGWSVFGARERAEGTDRASDARKTLMTAM